MNHPFHGYWITTPDFAELAPLPVYHKELAAPSYNAEDHPAELKNYHVLFAKTFFLKKKEGRYLLRFSADDYAKLSLNDRFVGQGPTPGFTEGYHYGEADVTDFLTEGENRLTAHVYYQGEINRVWMSGDYRMGLIADLLDPQGEVLLSSDPSWEYSRIPNYPTGDTVGYKTQYLENYDSRLPLPPFAPVSLRKTEDWQFDSRPCPLLQITEIPPVLTEPLPGGGLWLDFGKEITGAVCLSAVGKSGDRVRILCGEETDDSPCRVRYEMRCNCRYEEVWTLADGVCRLEPYDYKGFRYAALLPSSEEVKFLSVTATVRHFPIDETACTLETDNKALKDIFEMCKNGVICGTQEVYVDCPTREKGQYAGDMTVSSASQLWLTGDVFMLEKGILEQARSSAVCPGLMAVFCGSYMQEIADYSLQFPLLLLRHYAFTGDKKFLASMLPVAEGIKNHFSLCCRSDGMLEGVKDKWNLVDWPDNLRDGYDFPLPRAVGAGIHNVLNAFWVGFLLNLDEIRELLGLPTDGEGKKAAETFNRLFLSPGTGLYLDTPESAHSALHSNILPAFYGFVPEANREKVGAFLIGKGMACGVYMSFFLLKALCRLGFQDAAYRLIVSEGENSWCNMLREGATSCYEAWGKDKKWNTSLCHPWASAPVSVLIEELLGVSPDGRVGRCYLPADAGHVEMNIPTAKGRLHISAN